MGRLLKFSSSRFTVFSGGYAHSRKYTPSLSLHKVERSGCKLQYQYRTLENTPCYLLLVTVVSVISVSQLSADRAWLRYTILVYVLFSMPNAHLGRSSSSQEKKCPIHVWHIIISFRISECILNHTTPPTDHWPMSPMHPGANNSFCMYLTIYFLSGSYCTFIMNADFFLMSIPPQLTMAPTYTSDESSISDASSWIPIIMNVNSSTINHGSNMEYSVSDESSISDASSSSSLGESFIYGDLCYYLVDVRQRSLLSLLKGGMGSPCRHLKAWEVVWKQITHVSWVVHAPC